MSHGKTCMNRYEVRLIRVMSHVWISHGPHMNESWHTYEWVMAQHAWTDSSSHEVPHIWVRSHKRTSHGTRTNESWLTYEWVMAHVRMSHGAICMKRLLFASTDFSSHEARHVWVMSHVCEWVMAHISMSHGTYMHRHALLRMKQGMYESCHT